MTDPQPVVALRDDLVALYEGLRACALRAGGRLWPSPWGLGVLMGCGMASWVMAQSVTRTESDQTAGRAASALPPVPGPGPEQAELVAVLSEVVLTRCREWSDVE
jgi:hypothetical protein